MWAQSPFQQGAAPVMQYRFNGQVYSSMTELRAAVEAQRGGAVQPQSQFGLSDASLDERVRELFAQYAGADRRLQPHEFKGMAISLGAQLGVDHSAFAEADMLFWSFDFSGDGALEENECLELVKSMLRKYRDAHTAKFTASNSQLTTASIPKKSLEASFELSKKLGQGGQGAVYLAKDKTTGASRVVKFYDKSNANAPLEDIVAEFNLLKGLDHPKIARTYEVFQDFKNVYVVSEPYGGGDLSTCMQKASEAGVSISYPWLAAVLGQALEGVAYLHSKRMMHCDLKEPNVMISDASDWNSPSVVVIDFGLATATNSEGGVKGTPGYMPPEVWAHGLWTPKGDTFALGVMFYQLFTWGQLSPFPGNSIEDIEAHTMQCRPDLSPLGQHPTFQQMVARMLHVNFQQRPMVAEVLHDPWFKEAGQGTCPKISDDGLGKLAHVQKRSELYEALVTDMVAKQNLAQLKELNQIFESLDRDHDGTVSVTEIRQALAGRLPDSAIDNLVDASGKVSYKRFIAKMLAAKDAENGELLWKLFKEADTDGSGSLSVEEVSELLQKPAVAEAFGMKSSIPELIAKMDADKSGSIEFWEFKHALGADSGPTTGFRQGDKVQYFSTTHNGWLDAEITQVHPTGAVQINLKPNYWFKAAEQTKLRKVRVG